MSLAGVVIGTLVQGMLGYFLFMVVAITGGSAANGGEPGKVSMAVLNLSIYALPALCLVSAGIVIYLYSNGGGAHCYWWYTLPLVAAGTYLVYVMNLGG